MPKVNLPDLESEAHEARSQDDRVALVVRLLAVGEWVHGVTAYTLAGLWGIGPSESLGILDAALGQFATVPGTADALRGLGYARLCNLADRALAAEKTLLDKDGCEHTVPDPQYAVAVKATTEAFALALKGDPDETAADDEIEKLLAAIREGKL